ncbi:MAG: nicotinate phosphoribosyltransferase [Bradymonadia bacterium]|jgi:nicotinate phosphoribosyltransferase
MTTPATHLDLYQLTSLVPHFDAGLANTPVTMSFFSRRLPKGLDGGPTRGYLLWIGLRRCLDWLADVRFDAAHLKTLTAHPTLGAALTARPELQKRLLDWRFRGEIDAPREGTALTAGPAVRMDGTPLAVDGVRPAAQTPYLVVRCDLLTAKLIETPLLSIINHMTMVGTKASHVVAAAGTRAVLEFGSRRTHPQAAVDAAYAAWLAGCAGTSNVEAHHRYGVPALGTMDHFAIQAWERPDQPRHATERAFFEAFYAAYPKSAALLVDTYDTYGEQTGIRNAIRATQGRLSGIRLDSNISAENIYKARAILDAGGAQHATIVVSGGMDEHSIRALGDAPVDAFGVGERIVTSPDAPVGVGAVGKLCMVGGLPTMKMAKGSGKATLPGEVQVYRDDAGHDVIARADETLPGEPLIQPVWRGDAALPLPSNTAVRDYARLSVASLPAEARSPRFTSVRVSDALAARVESLVRR